MSAATPTHAGHWWRFGEHAKDWYLVQIFRTEDGSLAVLNGNTSIPLESYEGGEWGPEARRDDALARAAAESLISQTIGVGVVTPELAKMFVDWLRTWTPADPNKCPLCGAWKDRHWDGHGNPLECCRCSESPPTQTATVVPPTGIIQLYPCQHCGEIPGIYLKEINTVIYAVVSCHCSTISVRALASEDCPPLTSQALANDIAIDNAVKRWNRGIGTSTAF